MEKAKKGPMYVYHEYDGKMVMDECSHLSHWRESHRGDPKFLNDPLAAGWQKMTPEQIAKYEEHYGLKFEPASRPKLKEFSGLRRHKGRK